MIDSQLNREWDAIALRNDEQAGQRMLQEVYDLIGRFVAYPSDHAHVAHALWIVHAHLMDRWEFDAAAGGPFGGACFGQEPVIGGDGTAGAEPRLCGQRQPRLSLPKSRRRWRGDNPFRRDRHCVRSEGKGE